MPTSPTAAPTVDLNAAIVRNPLVVLSSTRAVDAIARMSQGQVPIQWQAVSENLLNDSLAEFHQAVRSSCMIVVESGQVIGLLTERDVVRLTAQVRSRETLTLREVPLTPAVPLPEAHLSNLTTILDWFQQHRIYHLPLVGDRGEVTGLITQESLYPLLQRIVQENQNSSVAHPDEVAPPPQEPPILKGKIPFQAFVEYSPTAAWITDIAGRIKYLSPAYRQMFLTPVDPVGQVVWDLYPPDVAQVYMNNIQTVVRTGQMLETVEPGVRLDGSIGEFLVLKFPLPDPSGQVDVGGVAVDITERKLAEIAAHESKQRYETLTQAVPVGIFRTDVNGSCLFVSDRWSQLAGLSFDQAMGDGWIQALHPEDRDTVLTEWYQAGQENRYFQLEYRLQRPDGSTLWVYGQAVAEHAVNGEIGSYVGTITDITNLKRVEEALAISEQRLRAIIEAEPECVKILGIDGTILEMNPAGLAMLEANAPQEVIGKAAVGCVLPSDRGAFVALSQRVLQGEPGKLEFAIQGLKGSQRWVDSHAVPLRDEHDNIIGILAITRDITERKQAELALTETKKQYQNLVENSPDVIERFDLDLRHLYVSPSLSAITGIPGTEFLGKSCRDLGMSEGMVSLWEAAAKRLLTTGQRQIIEFDTPTLNGVRSFEMAVAPEFSEHQTIESILCISRDVTERKAVETTLQQLNDELERLNNELELRIAERTIALQASEARFRGFFDFAPIGIAVADIETLQFSAVNQAFCLLLGYSKTELLDANSCRSITVPEDWEAERPYAEALLKGETNSYQIEKRYIKKTGEMMIASLTTTALRNQAGEVTYLLGMVQDITKRKQAELQLQQLNADLQRSNQELEQFAYIASHDLQEPLRAISGYTQLLAQEYGSVLSTPDAQQYLGFITDGAQRMRSLIQDLLTYSRAGSRPLNLVTIDCNVLLTEVLSNLRAAITESQVTIIVDPLPTLLGDRTQLLQVFQNLIGNAIKFRRQDEPLTVHIQACLCDQPDQHWLFSVQDNGIGIKAQYLDRIFEIFRRLHSQKKFPGTGIGLALCKKAIERHGGTIWAESTPNIGSTFYFTFKEAQST